MNKAGGMGGGQSVQRKQPYAASQTATQAPQFVTDTQAGGNADWLVHLDRQIVSLPEMFCVSAYQPCQLTHQFMQGGNTKAHLAPWFDQGSRLYRGLEFFNIVRQANGYTASPVSPSAVGTTTARESFPGEQVDIPWVWRRGPASPRAARPGPSRPGTRLLVGTGAKAEIVQVVSTPTNTSFIGFVRAPAGLRCQGSGLHPGRPALWPHQHQYVCCPTLSAATASPPRPSSALCAMRSRRAITSRRTMWTPSSRTCWPAAASIRRVAPAAGQREGRCGDRPFLSIVDRRHESWRHGSIRQAAASTTHCSGTTANCSRPRRRPTIPTCSSRCSPRSGTMSRSAATCSRSG